MRLTLITNEPTTQHACHLHLPSLCSNSPPHYTHTKRGEMEFSEYNTLWPSCYTTNNSITFFFLIETFFFFFLFVFFSLWVVEMFCWLSLSLSCSPLCSISGFSGKDNSGNSQKTTNSEEKEIPWSLRTRRTTTMFNGSSKGISRDHL